MELTFSDMLDTILAWARSEPVIEAVILTGSRARDDGSADELSDFDVELFADGHERYAASDAWMSSMGEVWLYLALPGHGGYPNRLVIYDGGTKVDFALRPLAALQEMIATKQLPRHYERGYRVLLDRSGLAAGLPPAPGRPTVRPAGQAEFTALVEEFLFEAYHVAKYLKRDDLWTAKVRDAGVKDLLLRMIELYERSLHGWDYDTWHLGHNMRAWAEPDVWSDVQRAFSRLDAAESWDALEATMQLFGRLARAAAERLGFSHPDDLDAKFVDFARGLREGG